MEHIEILYRDAHLLVVNKPAGVPVQKDKSESVTLIERVGDQVGQMPLLVHRLDRPVSGIVVFALTKEVQRALSRAFQCGCVSKEYRALTRYLPPNDADVLSHFISKNKSGNKAILSKDSSRGRKCICAYRVLGRSKYLTLLELRPKTGRFHQLRAQLAAIGCPVRGDVKYGDKRTNKRPGINLHAWGITFQHPVNGTVVAVEAPPPDWPEWSAFAGDSPDQQ